MGSYVLRCQGCKEWKDGESRWRDLCLYHSRFYAKRDGKHFSKLCVADKLSIVLTPWWLYLPLTRLSGELSEYMARCQPSNGDKYAGMNVFDHRPKEWYLNVQDYLRRWVEEHIDMKPDTWTPEHSR